jgi:hypothetical protein
MVSLATLGTIAGAVIYYGSIIVSVAAIAYSIFFAPEAKIPDQRTEGARLGDLQVTTSTYGKDIPPAVYGTIRFGGNMIWATPLEERRRDTVHRVNAGGKGGGGGSYKHTEIEYMIYGHFAIQFSAGVAAENGLVRVWGDGKLIWDRRVGQPMTKKYAEMDIRFYRGTADQMPDSFIESHEGTGEVPGHRDIVYIVIQDMPLIDFGNRPPNFTAEISYNATGASPLTVIDTYTDTFEGMLYDEIDERLFLHDGSHPNGGVINIDLKEDLIESTRAITDFQDTPPATFELQKGAVLSPDGFPVYQMNDPPANNDRIFALNPHSLETESTVRRYAPGFPSNQWWRDATLVHQAHKKGLGQFAFGVGNGWNIVNLSSRETMELDVQYQDWGFFGDLALNDGIACVTDKNHQVWVVGSVGSPSSASAFLWQYSVEFLTPTVCRGEEIREVDLSAYIHAPHLLCYDAGTHSLLIGSRFNSYGRDYTIIRWDIDSRSIVWQITDADTTSGNLTSDNAFYLFKYGPDAQYLYSYDGPSSILYQIRISDGEITKEYNLSDFGVAHSLQVPWHHNTTHTIVAHDRGGGGTTSIVRLWLDRANTSPVALEEVIDDLATRTGLSSADLDLTSIVAAGEAVRGYIVSKQSTVRAAIEPLGFAHFFDAIESDNKVKFVKRGASPSITIPEDDLGAASGGSRDSAAQLLIEELAMEAELPRRVELRFRDPVTDYDQGMEYATRVASPPEAQTQGSDEVQSVEIAMVLLPEEALAIVESILYQVWTNRNGYEFKTLPKWQLLEPTDVIYVEKGGNTHVVKLVSTGLGAGYLCEMAGAHDDPETYTFSGLATTSGLGHHDQQMVLYGRSRLFLMDIPLLRDIDDPGTMASLLYMAVGATSDFWRGALIQKSMDGVAFEQIEVPWNPVGWGFAVQLPGGSAFDNALDPYYRWTVWDRESTLRVRMVDGADALVSITELQCLNNGNAALLGNEIIKFQTVSGPDGDGIYSLTNLIRGRRGTGQWAEAGHPRGDRFILLTTSTVTASIPPLDDIGTTRFYRAITIGARIDDAALQDLTLTAASQKPYSVSHLYGTRDGSNNIDLVWIRRTRIGGALDWNDGITEVPLNETTESYSIDYFEEFDTGTVTAGSTTTTLRDAGHFTGYETEDLVGKAISVQHQDDYLLVESSFVVEKDDNDTIEVWPPWSTAPVTGDSWVIANDVADHTDTESSESSQYSAGEQTSVGDVIYATVYQVSSLVGRGFPNSVWVW